ncbi:NTP transferase domain-containing protein [Desulfonatronovibrio hydrogenovorans]|uniref:phosphocholine cytidylyltransferase family protein n=1 Tax=Desulfonatronovibrio hydrogenovorans TaxID=53245 RepID=UPI000491DBF6|nr:phosphocholine cytidylyltransferase family protein [Desulfonatronovibrio hydrogenovorans]
MKAVILAAGVGSRLGRPFPKCLTQMPGGEPILGRQIRILNESGVNQVIVVVGFKKTLIMEQYPEALYKYNPFYYITNTSKSLLCALENVDDDVLWVNGDVVFDSQLIRDVLDHPFNTTAVDRKKCGAEEVKYTEDDLGFIASISKEVERPLGEAVGVNKIQKNDIKTFIQALKDCHDEDYFEKGMELAISKGVKFKALDISRYRCIEVDFEEDLIQAKDMFAISSPSPAKLMSIKPENPQNGLPIELIEAKNLQRKLSKSSAG